MGILEGLKTVMMLIGAIIFVSSLFLWSEIPINFIYLSQIIGLILIVGAFILGKVSSTQIEKKEMSEEEAETKEVVKKKIKSKSIKREKHKKTGLKIDTSVIMSVLLVIGLLLLFYFYGINNSLKSEYTQATQNTALSKQNNDKCSNELNSVKTDLGSCQQSISSFLNTKTQYQNNIADCKDSTTKTNSLLSDCNSKISSTNSQLSTCNSQLQVYGGCA